MAATTALEIDDESPSRPRQTQTERVEAMRARLLAATIDCLVESGYSEMSTNDVVRRAGVSRGALAHHFPTKAELVVAAAERLVTERAEQFRGKFRELPPAQRTVEEALEVLWSFFDDPSFAAFAELTVAARTNPELRAVIAKTPDQIADVTRAVFGETFPDLADLPFLDEALRAILAMYTGMALHSFAHDDAQTRTTAVRALLSTLATLATAVASSRRTP
jgi:AcrR family transcriptional regulator